MSVTGFAIMQTCLGVFEGRRLLLATRFPMPIEPVTAP